MADYKELLRRAIKALPENNGAARRGVYEKARSALVGQLRAINPPLPAKDITQHRLQLEDCIRQVEQEASEAVITLKRQHHHDEPAASRPYAAPQAVPPVSKPETSASAQPATAAEALADGKPDPVKAEPVKSEPVAAEPAPQAVATDPGSAGKPEAGSIEDIIAQAEAAGGKLLREGKPETAKAADKPDDKPATKTPQPEPRPGPRPVPSIVARAEAAKAGPTSPIGLVGGSGPRLFDSGRRAPGFDPRRDAAHAAAAHHVPVAAPRLEPSIRAQSSARQQVAEPLSFVDQAAVAPAMSAVREVDVERDLAAAPTADAENAIERAIATLDREARGDTPPVNGTRIEFPGASPANGAAAALRDEPDETSSRGPIAAETGFGRGAMERERGGGSAVTIFLLVFVVLLAGAGGGGYWAYREGYINIDQMFGRTTQSVVGGTVIPETGADAATAELANPATEAIELVTGPGNTAPLAEAIDPAIELGTDERLTPGTAVAAAADPALSGDPAAPATMADPATEALALAATAPAGEAVEAEERLPSSDVALGDAQLPEGTAGSAFPEAIAGSQSLLLEAADDGTTGAVPFSGTVDWSKGIDELGQPTLVGTANIPARNLTVDLMIRKNADPSLPASHVMEIDFTVNATFIGGSVAQLPGVLLKDAELVQGTPLVGASARVVGNSFLFALSASAQDNATNIALMTSRKWIDLALVYATGKRAIITLEKDEAAEALFAEVFAAWSATTDSASTVQ